METVEKLAHEARMLPPDELRRLIEMLSQYAEPEPVMSEEAFQSRLLDAGILSELPGKLDERLPSRDFRPVIVEGKPLSETIIEERR
ncbi:MAG: hypothetical protein ACREEM_35085 [Blastocatellia bacterium]